MPLRTGDGTGMASVRLGNGTGIAEVRRGDGTVLFSSGPGTPPDSGNLEMWYDPRLLEGYSTNDDVSSYPDQQGNHDLTANAGYEATYDAGGINGTPALLFVDSVLISGQFSSAIDQPITVYAVMNADDTEPEDRVWYARDRSVSSGFIDARTLNGNWMVSAGSYDNPLHSVPASPTVVAGRYDDSNSTNYVYRSAESVSISDGNMGEFNLGALYEGQDHFSGYLGTVLVYNAGHDTSTMHSVADWLADGYGISA